MTGALILEPGLLEPGASDFDASHIAGGQRRLEQNTDERAVAAVATTALERNAKRRSEPNFGLCPARLEPAVSGDLPNRPLRDFAMMDGSPERGQAFSHEGCEPPASP